MKGRIHTSTSWPKSCAIQLKKNAFLIIAKTALRAKSLCWCSNRHRSCAQHFHLIWYFLKFSANENCAHVIDSTARTTSRVGAGGGVEINTAVSIWAPAQKFCPLINLPDLRVGVRPVSVFAGPAHPEQVGPQQHHGGPRILHLRRYIPPKLTYNDSSRMFVKICSEHLGFI